MSNSGYNTGFKRLADLWKTPLERLAQPGREEDTAKSIKEQLSGKREK